MQTEMGYVNSACDKFYYTQTCFTRAQLSPNNTFSSKHCNINQHFQFLPTIFSTRLCCLMKFVIRNMLNCLSSGGEGERGNPGDRWCLPTHCQHIETSETLIVVNFVLVKDCFNTFLLESRRGESRRGHHIFPYSLYIYLCQLCVCV